jgi:hypothetical protein
MLSLTPMTETRYPKLWQLILGYFNEDAGFRGEGENVEEIARTYRRESSTATQNLFLLEIDQFKKDNISNIDGTFQKEFGGQFNPTLWKHSIESFLNELKRLLQE